MSKRRNPTDTDGNNKATQGTSVAKKAPQRFKDSYEEAFPFLTSPKKGLAFAYCLAFEKDFTRAHGHDGGKDDCRRHAKSKAHVDLKELKLTQKPLKHFINNAEMGNTRAVTKAEALMCHLIYNLNLSFQNNKLIVFVFFY